MLRFASLLCLLSVLATPVLAAEAAVPSEGRYTLPILIAVGAVAVGLLLLYAVLRLRKKH